MLELLKQMHKSWSHLLSCAHQWFLGMSNHNCSSCHSCHCSRVIWEYLTSQQWNEFSSLEWQMTHDVEQFCVGVANHKDASGKNDFCELSEFTLSVLALPFWNAAVERVFSQMNGIKTKLRNRMKQDILEALMRICRCMARNNICCNTFVQTARMLQRLTTYTCMRMWRKRKQSLRTFRSRNTC